MSRALPNLPKEYAVPTGRRILIIDDNEPLNRSLAEALTDHGHEVLAVVDGETAFVLAHDFNPHIMLLDLAMPGGMDGYEICQRFRALPKFDDTRIYAHSGTAAWTDQQRVADSGFDFLLGKPMNWDLLITLISIH
ncbi:MAG: response regulator [Asticcacaulis sp.]|uniref:response regulator n=1 Tax=Asticcacaulis sp. TaxID=1872648 RepID=UPI0039E6A93C